MEPLVFKLYFLFTSINCENIYSLANPASCLGDAECLESFSSCPLSPLPTRPVMLSSHCNPPLLNLLSLFKGSFLKSIRIVKPGGSLGITKSCNKLNISTFSGMLCKSKSLTSLVGNREDFCELRFCNLEIGKRGERLFKGLGFVVVDDRGVHPSWLPLEVWEVAFLMPSVKSDSKVSKRVSQRQTIGGSNHITLSGLGFFRDDVGSQRLQNHLEYDGPLGLDKTFTLLWLKMTLSADKMCKSVRDSTKQEKII
uniref:Uncharacterized protein n=1 Tax=Glossina pallidipes TaxID=7398 RepID=A0A1B0ADM0_GLOPL